MHHLPLVQGITLFVIMTVLIRRLLAYLVKRKQDQDFARAHRCKTVSCYLPYKWPLSLDILKKQYDALPSQRLLALWTVYFEQLKPTFSVHLFGVTGYATTDPENIEAINRIDFQHWGLGSRREGCLPFLGDGIFTQDGQAWQHSRELISRQFRRVKHHELVSMRESAQILLSKVANLQGVIDLQPHFYRFTLSTTTHLLFGEPIHNLGENAVSEFCDSFDYASEVVSIRLRLADACWLYTPLRFRRSCATVKQYADHFVQRALKARSELGEEKAFDLYPFILDLFRNLKDHVKVRDQLVNVLIAGRDSTADTLGWTFFQLVRHPQVLERLRKEMSTIVGDDPDFEHSAIKQMTYLGAVIKEVLRLYPQLPVNLRFTTHTTMLPRGGGSDGLSPVLMPKGTGVASSVYHMHRRQDLFGQDAGSFRPERWLSGELDNIGAAYIPFHSGPRTCLGKDFARTQLSYLTIRLLQSFPALRLPDDATVEPVGMERQHWSLLVSSADGCKVVLN